MSAGVPKIWTCSMKLDNSQPFGLAFDEEIQDSGNLSELSTNTHTTSHLLCLLLVTSLLMLTLQVSSECKSLRCTM